MGYSGFSLAFVDTNIRYADAKLQGCRINIELVYTNKLIFSWKICSFTLIVSRRLKEYDVVCAILFRCSETIERA